MWLIFTRMSAVPVYIKIFSNIIFISYFSVIPLSYCIFIIMNIKRKWVNFMEEFLTAIANIGFPIAVAAYLLIRIESKMDSLSTSINQLSTILSVKLGSNDKNKGV